MANDPKYFTTYYAIDAINYRPVNITSALKSIEALSADGGAESAGLPLDPSFAEQKQIFERCRAILQLREWCGGPAVQQNVDRAGLIKGSKA
jgi:hypothetical protein